MADRQSVEAEIGQLQMKFMELRGQLQELYQKLPAEEVQDYNFTDTNGELVKLSELFGDKDELLLIHNMGKSCKYCMLWADGFNGMTQHFENRAAFALESADAAPTLKTFVESRGWTFKSVSSHGTEFKKDMGFWADKGDWAGPQPGVSAFSKTPDGKILRHGKSFLGPGDPFCSVWHLFDLFKNGVNDWNPSDSY